MTHSIGNYMLHNHKIHQSLGYCKATTCPETGTLGSMEHEALFASQFNSQINNQESKYKVQTPKLVTFAHVISNYLQISISYTVVLLWYLK